MKRDWGGSQDHNYYQPPNASFVFTVPGADRRQGRTSPASVSLPVNDRVELEMISMTLFGHNVLGSYDSADTTGSVLFNRWFSTGGDSAPPARGHLAFLVVTTGGWTLLALKGWRLGTLLNSLTVPGI